VPQRRRTAQGTCIVAYIVAGARCGRIVVDVELHNNKELPRRSLSECLLDEVAIRLPAALPC
jgi:hypothetical protein